MKSGGPFLIRRVGRRLLWQRPHLYRWFGLMRRRGDCFESDFDFWVGGFPRSANTFSVEAFRMANPTLRVVSPRHIPPFIIRCLEIGKPGMLVIRQPKDAVVSWAIYWNGYLEQCLDYYIDFHRALQPHARELFVASFEVVTTQFGRVVESFNQRFGTNYSHLPHNPEMVANCFSRIEEIFAPNGEINELTVARPSASRARLKYGLVEQLRRSPLLQRKLERANELYATFCPVRPSRSPGHNNSTQNIPVLGAT